MNSNRARILFELRKQSVKGIDDKRPASRDCFEGFLGKTGNLDVVRLYSPIAR